MNFYKNKLNFFIVIIFLASCSSMNVTEEKVYDGDVKTVTASSESVSYTTKAVFANATVYFEFDKSNLTSKSIQTLKSAVNAMNKNSLSISQLLDMRTREEQEYNSFRTRRAESVKDYFVLNGISSNRITVKSYGRKTSCKRTR